MYFYADFQVRNKKHRAADLSWSKLLSKGLLNLNSRSLTAEQKHHITFLASTNMNHGKNRRLQQKTEVPALRAAQCDYIL